MKYVYFVYKQFRAVLKETFCIYCLTLPPPGQPRLHGGIGHLPLHSPLLSHYKGIEFSAIVSSDQ
jgi:hypothetical protein